MKLKFFLIVLLCSSLLMLLKTSDKNQAKTLPMIQAAEYMNNIVLYKFDNFGVLTHAIQALSWSFNKSTDRAIIEKPYLRVWRGASIWHIKSSAAYLWHKTISHVDSIDLYGNVVVEKFLPSGSKPEVELEAQHVHYDLAKDNISTDTYVSLVKPGLKITGQGLWADIKNGNAKILHDVKTIVEFNNS